jgi:hypothetical protein
LWHTGGLALSRLATSCFPRKSPSKYPRRWRSSRPCSVWVRVFPLRYGRQTRVFAQAASAIRPAVAFARTARLGSGYVFRNLYLTSRLAFVPSLSRLPSLASDYGTTSVTAFFLRVKPSTDSYLSAPHITTLPRQTDLPCLLQGVLLPLRNGIRYLEAGFALRCFQRLSLPDLATQLCLWRDNWYTSGRFIPVLSY